MRIMESPAFQEVKDSGTEAPKPIVDVIKTQPREVLVAMGMRIAENGIFYVYTVFVLAYGEETLKLGKSTMLTGVALAAAVGLMTIPLWGRLSDRFGRKPMYMAGAVFSLLFCFPFFALVDTKEPVLIWLAIVLGVNVGHDLMYGPQAAYYSELFGTRVRYSGASLGYQLASVLSGGFAPLIAAALLAANDGSPTLVAAYMAVMGVITVVATAMAPETYRSEIREARPEERRFFREGEEGAVQPTRTRAQPVGR
jgi:MHS family shikimate/dehydroshikimate transporter-like MFS transporter